MHYCHCRYLSLILSVPFQSPFDFSLDEYLTMMTDSCPIGSDTVDKNCLQCDKCNDWIHYRCSNLPAYFIIQLSTSKRVYTCHSCMKLKHPLAFQKLHDDIEEIIMSPVNQSSSPIKPTILLTPSAPSSTPLLPAAPLISISPLTPISPTSPSFSIHHTNPSPSTCSTVSICRTSSPNHSSPNKSTRPSTTILSQQ